MCVCVSNQQLGCAACVCDRCHFNLPSVEAEEETHSKLPPIKVKFEIPYFTVSGMQVRGVLNAMWVGGWGTCGCSRQQGWSTIGC